MVELGTTKETTNRAGARRATAMPADERRAAIVAATEPLLVAEGEAITTRQIAAAAGIAEGTIFRVFADKDEVLAATIEAALDTTAFEAALGSIDHAATFEAQLTAAVEIVAGRISHVWALLSNVGPRLREQASRPLDDSPALIELFTRWSDRIDTTPERAARLLRSFTLATTHPMVTSDPLDAGAIVDVLLHGIEVRS